MGIPVLSLIQAGGQNSLGVPSTIPGTAGLTAAPMGTGYQMAPPDNQAPSPNQVTGGVTPPPADSGTLPITVLPGKAPADTTGATAEGLQIAGLNLSWPVILGIGVVVFLIYQARNK
jgi:hypothetical protein